MCPEICQSVGPGPGPGPVLPCVNYFLIDTTIMHSNYTWDPYPDATGYNVYASPLNDPLNYSLIHANVPVSIFEIIDQNITVTAITPAGESPKCDPITYESSCPELTEFLSRVSANGGVEPPIEEQFIVCQFIADMKAAALWDKMKSVIYFSPNGRETALTWLKKGPMEDTWNWLTPGDVPTSALPQEFLIKGFNNNTYHSESTVPLSSVFTDTNNFGFTGYGTGPYAHVADPVLPEATDILGAWCGAVPSPANPSFPLDGFDLHPWKPYSFDPIFGLTRFAGYEWSGAGTQTPSGGQLLTQQANKGAGYVSLNRLDASRAKVYYAASNQAHTTILDSIAGSGFPLPNGNIVFFKDRFQNNYYQGYTSFMAFHDGLTESESAIFFSLIQNFRMALGGGYV